MIASTLGVGDSPTGKLEDTIVYLAAIEAALTQRGVLQEGEVRTHLLDQTRRLTHLRSMISGLSG